MSNGKDPTQTPTEISPEEPEVSPPESPESPPSSLIPAGEPSGEPPQEPEELVVTPAEEAEAFQHPLLAGKSAEEIETLVSAMVDANRSQNAELNAQHTRLRELQSSEPAAPAPIESPYGEGFMAESFEVLEARTKEAMAEMVEPLKAEVRAGKTSTTRENLRRKLKHFALLESTIDGQLREQRIDPATADEGLLVSLYYTALGAATEGNIPLGTETPTPTREEPPVNIPQHRPSATPLPEEPRPAVRPLTENERILAKAQFPHSEDPEGDYRKWQDMEIDEIVEPGFSREGW